MIFREQFNLSQPEGKSFTQDSNQGLWSDYWSADNASCFDRFRLHRLSFLYYNIIMWPLVNHSFLSLSLAFWYFHNIASTYTSFLCFFYHHTPLISYNISFHHFPSLTSASWSLVTDVGLAFLPLSAKIFLSHFCVYMHSCIHAFLYTYIIRARMHTYYWTILNLSDNNGFVARPALNLNTLQTELNAIRNV